VDLEDYKPRHNNYQPLREVEASQKTEPEPAKQSEVETNQKTEAAPEASRPETVRQPGYTQSQSMDAVQPSANDYDKAAQLHMQKQWEARQQPDAPPQSEKSENQQPDDTKAAYRELAQKLTANQQRTPEREREHELQKQYEQGR